MNSREIKMKIRSLRYDVEESFFSKQSDDITQDILDPAEDIAELFEEEDAIELSTEGVLNIDEEKVEIVYEESEITGMEGSKTSVYFESDNAGFVSMMRSGMVSTSLLFEKGKRHHCVYNTPIMPFEICVRTLKVENEILTSGTLKLDYIIEIRGNKAERTKFEMTVIGLENN